MNNSTLQNPAYENSRIRVGAIFWFIFGFILTMILLLQIVWLIQTKIQNPARGGPIILPTEPLPQPLQPSPEHPLLPWQDLAALRAAQEERLNSAGPNHIPIQQAMDQLLQSGVLTHPWQNPATMPYLRPRNETPTTRSVENHT